MRNLESIPGGQVTSASAIDQIERLQGAVETVIKGKPEAIRLAIVTLIGFHVAGVIGALVATFAMCGPSAILAYSVSNLLARSTHSPWPALL